MHVNEPNKLHKEKAVGIRTEEHLAVLFTQTLCRPSHTECASSSGTSSDKQEGEKKKYLQSSD